MSLFMRILMWTGQLSGIGALILGALNWFFHISFIEIHMLFGYFVTVALLTAGLVAISARGLRMLGVMSIIFALIVPVFGMNQVQILVGDFHWLIQVAHLLVGAATIILTERISEQCIKLKQKSVTGKEAIQAS